MKSVLVATAFLTRIPVAVAADAAGVGSAVRWFPIVGGALGALAAVLAWVMRDALDVPAALVATLLVGLGAYVTGAIHLDGLADTADGFGGGRTRDDVLRIMRDPVIGAFGATALVIVLATKVAALTALIERGVASSFLVAAPAISRWTVSVLAASQPYARADGGLGQAVVHQHVTALLISTACTAVIAFAAAGTDAMLAWVPALLVTIWLARASRRRIGGVTGDVFGASVELAETAVLLGGVVLTRA